MAPSSAVGPAGPGITCQVTRLGGMWGGGRQGVLSLVSFLLGESKGHIFRCGVLGRGHSGGTVGFNHPF